MRKKTGGGEAPTKYERLMGEPWVHAAYEEKLRVSSTRRVIGAWKRGLRASLDDHELEETAQFALLRAVCDHRDNKGRSFETSLRQFLDWEASKLFRKRAARRRRSVPIGDAGVDDLCAETVKAAALSVKAADQFARVMEQAERYLPTKVRRLLVGYYLEGWTYDELARLEGLTKETVIHKVAGALAKLREVSEFFTPESENVNA